MTRAATSLVLASVIAIASTACTSRDELPAPCGEDYGGCDEVRTCGGGATCKPVGWVFGSGSVCTRTCDTELDCPRARGRAGRCIDVNRNGDFECYLDCGADGECSGTGVCQPIRSGGVDSAICLP